MKLALGTVQFGMNYGLGSPRNQLSLGEARAVLNVAIKAGIDTLDTAISYGESENRLGEIGVNRYRLISKLPPIVEPLGDIEHWAMSQVRGSLERLGVTKLDSVLLHSPGDILGTYGQSYIRALRRIKDEGLATSVGYSIYSPDEIQPLLDVFHPDLIQAPFNIIDRRLLSSGWMETLNSLGVRIHTRSVFLQGVLLLGQSKLPNRFARWQSLFDVWAQTCKKLEVSPLALSLNYALSQPQIEKVVVGVENVEQLRQIISAAANFKIDEFPDVSSQDLALIDPRGWQ